MHGFADRWEDIGSFWGELVFRVHDLYGSQSAIGLSRKSQGIGFQYWYLRKLVQTTSNL